MIAIHSKFLCTFVSYRKMPEVMELASEPPEIKFITAAQTEGLALIEEIRG